MKYTYDEILGFFIGIALPRRKVVSSTTIMPKNPANKAETYRFEIVLIEYSGIIPLQKGEFFTGPKLSINFSKPSGLFEAKGIESARKIMIKITIAKCFFKVLSSPSKVSTHQ